MFAAVFFFCPLGSGKQKARSHICKDGRGNRAAEQPQDDGTGHGYGGARPEGVRAAPRPAGAALPPPGCPRVCGAGEEDPSQKLKQCKIEPGKLFARVN